MKWSLETTRRKGLLRRAIVVWLIVIFAESLHGVLRAVFLVPLTGELRARQIGVFTGSAIIFGVSFLCARWLGGTSKASLVAVGLLWLVLTLLFEFILGRFVFQYSWSRLAADYNISEGGLMLIGLLVLIFSPLIAARIRGGV